MPDRHPLLVTASGQLPPQERRGSEALGQGRGDHRGRERGGGEEGEGHKRCEHIDEPCDAPLNHARLDEAFDKPA